MKGTAGEGFVRDSSRRLDASMAVSEEDIVGIASLWGENSTVFLGRSPRVSGTYIV